MQVEIFRVILSSKSVCICAKLIIKFKASSKESTLATEIYSRASSLAEMMSMFACLRHRLTNAQIRPGMCDVQPRLTDFSSLKLIQIVGKSQKLGEFSVQ